VRYESTEDAAGSFSRAVEAATPLRAYAEHIDQPALGDELLAWQFGASDVIVDEMLIRRRNFLLNLAVLRVPVINQPTNLVLRYAELLRSKLRD
jgi:hypothetical protein